MKMSNMTKTIYTKFDKSKIHLLPRELFPGRIIVVTTVADAGKAVRYLLTRPMLGLDTETRPMFHRGQQHKVALLQVSDETTCFLFRLNRIGMPECILQLLRDTTVPKVGLSLHDDILMLHHRAPFAPGKYIDLQDHAKELGIEDLSLQKLYANIFGRRISKREQLSNWERSELTEQQQKYAATDAWACIQLYNEMLRLKETGDYRLVDTSHADDAPADDGTQAAGAA